MLVMPAMGREVRVNVSYARYGPRAGTPRCLSPLPVSLLVDNSAMPDYQL